MDETIFPAGYIHSHGKKCSLRPGNARLQKSRAWELRCHPLQPLVNSSQVVIECGFAM